MSTNRNVLLNINDNFTFGRLQSKLCFCSFYSNKTRRTKEKFQTLAVSLFRDSVQGKIFTRPFKSSGTLWIIHTRQKVSMSCWKLSLSRHFSVKKIKKVTVTPALKLIVEDFLTGPLWFFSFSSVFTRLSFPECSWRVRGTEGWRGHPGSWREGRRGSAWRQLRPEEQETHETFCHLMEIGDSTPNTKRTLTWNTAVRRGPLASEQRTITTQASTI